MTPRHSTMWEVSGWHSTRTVPSKIPSLPDEPEFICRYYHSEAEARSASDAMRLMGWEHLSILPPSVMRNLGR